MNGIPHLANLRSVSVFGLSSVTMIFDDESENDWNRQKVLVAMAPVGGLLALYLTGTHFSVSSGVGFLALFGVAVQTGVIMVEYINQLRVRGHSIEDSAIEGAVLRLRPIMMTALVATLGLLPAATSRGIGSDSQRPFAIVIVGGLMAALLLSIFLLPTIYVWIAGEHDALPAAEGVFEDV
jgi:cobalt-zinc-cadmium resistance protein CzcA